MAEIRKGIVTRLHNGGTSAVIRPFGGGETETPPLPVQRISVQVPEHTGSGDAGGVTVPAMTFIALHPRVSVGDVVAFILFHDGTGLIIDKIGGE